MCSGFCKLKIFQTFEDENTHFSTFYHFIDQTTNRSIKKMISSFMDDGNNRYVAAVNLLAFNPTSVERI